MKKVSSVSKILLLLLLLFLRSQICDLRSKKFFLRNFHFKVSNAKKKENTHPPLSPPKKLLVLFLHEGGGKGGVVTPLLSPLSFPKTRSATPQLCENYCWKKYYTTKMLCMSKYSIYFDKYTLAQRIINLSTDVLSFIFSRQINVVAD